MTVSTPSARSGTSIGREPGSRRTILDVAERLMNAQGYDRASITAISRESGLPVGSIYHHFSNKAGLLAAVMDRWSTRFFAELPTYEREAADPEAQFHTYWSGAVEAILHQHAAFLLEADLMRLSHRDPDLQPVMGQVRDTMQRHLVPTFAAFARDQGVQGADDLALRLAALTESATRGLVLTWGADRDAFRAAMHDLYIAVRSTISAARSW